MELIASIFLAFNNGMRAKKKGHSALLWGFITIVAIFLMMMIGSGIVMGFFYRGPITPVAVTQFLQQNIIHAIFIFAVGVGGYLIIRYILERMKPILPPRRDE